MLGLNPADLAEALTKIDAPVDPVSAATEWYEAFFSYYKSCVHLDPLKLPVAYAAGLAAFTPLMVPVLSVPQPTSVPFYMALEASLREVMAKTLLPTSMLPGLAYGSAGPLPLATPLLLVDAVALVPGVPKDVPRTQMAVQIDLWMRTGTVTTTSSPPAVLPIA